MLWNIISVTVLLTLFSEVYSENTFLNETIHIRVKRGKYYSYPSKFYRRPPNTYPVKGAFSLTPPPGYMMDEEEPPYPGPGRPHDRPKVSKRPNDGLRDEDITNIVKYLSKQDLDKLIDFASEKDRIRENSIERRPFKRDESSVIKDTEYSSHGFSFNGPYKVHDTDKGPGHWISRESDSVPLNFKPHDDVFNRPFKSQDTEQYGPFRSQNNENFRPFTSQNAEQLGPFKSQYTEQPGAFKSQNIDQFGSSKSQQTEEFGPYKNQNTEHVGPFKRHENDHKYEGPYAPTEDLLNYVEDATQSKIVYVNNNNANLQTEESMQNKQISYLNTFIHHEINDMPKQAVINNEREEVLPRPVNLREEDFDISYTNNVPTVVKGPSYKVENFGDLPLMSNSYKLDTVSSYKVPHYTVTSNAKYSPPPPPPSSVRLEPAPPVSAAKEQSDAHLKAIKIWTHRSQGTAYTLHNDGSLSLERQKPKTRYGP